MRFGGEQSRPPKRQLVAQVAAPVRRFLATEAGSAGVLLAAAVLALVWANSPWSDAYESLWHTELSLLAGGHGLSMDLGHWIDDAAMALFFFVIGLEVRRELSIGELTDRRRITVPAVAALAGIAVPALLYLAINPAGEAARGWGVVIGTDTAFLLGALAIVGPACPTQLRVFLLTLTVFDDIVAVSIIGIVYSESLDVAALAVAAACLVVLAVLSRRGEWRAGLYVIPGVVLWVSTLESGLHPSIAGMVAGLLIASRVPERAGVERADSLFRAFRQSPLPDVGHTAQRGLQRAVPVSERMQIALHPWTSYVIVPLFALANAGVDLRGGLLGDALGSPVTWAIVLGLAGGKLLGIGAGALLALRFNVGALPRGVRRGQVLGGAALSGIGFTVSLLIAGLAFESTALREQATVGVLLAAGVAALGGWIVFALAARLRGERSAGLPMLLDRPVDPARDHIRGPAGAPLTLVEYGDFECPFCGRATGVVRELRERFGDELRYVFRHLPLADVHPHAELAARAAEVAGAHGAFWPFHDLLFDHQDALEVDDLFSYAAAVGLDPEAFARELDDARHAARVRADVASADAGGAQGTPTFFIGDRRHVGPYDADTLAGELERLRPPLAAPPPQGTQPV
jgi:Na+/H+ antiporter NhaA